MTNFNYEKAYCVQALPALRNLNSNQLKTHGNLLPLVEDLQQLNNLNIPLTEKIINEFKALTCQEIAELSRASYFCGHWKPSLMPALFKMNKGQSWKITNVCDQVLKNRLMPVSNIQIHEGIFRVTFLSKDCWLWKEFGLATEKNLEIFKTCGLFFNEININASANKLTKLCADLWPDIDTVPDNDDYKTFLEIKKIKEIEKLKEQNSDKLKRIKKDIESSKIELKAFTWLIENNILIDNCIFYSHTDRFCFGWKDKLSNQEKVELEKALIRFPYLYDFKD